MKSVSLPFYQQGFDPTKIDYSEIPELVKFLKNGKFDLNDAGVSPRLFFQWKKAGLLSSLDTGRQWTKLNFVEFIWLKIIADLRHFGIPILDIKRIHDRYAYDMASMIEKVVSKEQMDALLETITESFPNLTPAQREEARQDIFSKDFMRRVFAEKPVPTTFLETTLVHMIALHQDVSLTLFLTPHVFDIYFENIPAPNDPAPGKRKKTRRKTCVEFFFHTDDFRNMEIDKEKLQRIFNTPHIKIPLRSYLTDFISNLKFEPHLDNSGLLSSEELRLLKLLHKNDVTEITIKMNQHKGNCAPSINRIEVTSALKKSAEARLIETYSAHEYADISYKVVDGEITSFKKVSKIKP